MRFVKPLDDTLILELAAQHDALVTLERKRHYERRWQQRVNSANGPSANLYLCEYRSSGFLYPARAQEEARAEWSGAPRALKPKSGTAQRQSLFAHPLIAKSDEGMRASHAIQHVGKYRSSLCAFVQAV